MSHPFGFLFDGSVQRALPGWLVPVATGWAGLVVLLVAATLAVAVDVHRQGAVQVAADGAPAEEGRPRFTGTRLRRAGFVLALVLAAVAVGATLVRFAELT